MAKKFNATGRTMELLKEEGYMVGVVERFITAGANRAFGNRVDLFGFIDLIAVNPMREDPLERTVGIQCFTTAWAEHENKILSFQEEDGRVTQWMDCGNSVELWGWRKLKIKRGGKAVRWTPKVKVIEMNYLGQLEFREIEL